MSCQDPQSATPGDARDGDKMEIPYYADVLVFDYASASRRADSEGNSAVRNTNENNGSPSRDLPCYYGIFSRSLLRNPSPNDGMMSSWLLPREKTLSRSATDKLRSKFSARWSLVHRIPGSIASFGANAIEFAWSRSGCVAYNSEGGVAHPTPPVSRPPRHRCWARGAVHIPLGPCFPRLRSETPQGFDTSMAATALRWSLGPRARLSANNNVLQRWGLAPQRSHIPRYPWMMAFPGGDTREKWLAYAGNGPDSQDRHLYPGACKMISLSGHPSSKHSRKQGEIFLLRQRFRF